MPLVPTTGEQSLRPEGGLHGLQPLCCAKSQPFTLAPYTLVPYNADVYAVLGGLAPSDRFAAAANAPAWSPAYSRARSDETALRGPT